MLGDTMRWYIYLNQHTVATISICLIWFVPDLSDRWTRDNATCIYTTDTSIQTYFLLIIFTCMEHEYPFKGPLDLPFEESTDFQSHFRSCVEEIAEVAHHVIITGRTWLVCPNSSGPNPPHYHVVNIHTIMFTLLGGWVDKSADTLRSQWSLNHFANGCCPTSTGL